MTNNENGNTAPSNHSEGLKEIIELNDWLEYTRLEGKYPGITPIKEAHEKIRAFLQNIPAPAPNLEPTISAIMEQAQVFASTYSLVGGRFDDGSKMAQSNEEKADLERMIRAALAASEGSKP